MKRRTKLNEQLSLTLTGLVIASIIAFGLVMPVRIRCFFDNKNYDAIISKQKELIAMGTSYEVEVGRRAGIYHIFYNEKNEALFDEHDEDLLHQKLMYKNFFEQVRGVLKTEKRSVSMHKYKNNDETIYYVLDKSIPGSTMVSYKVDTSSQNLSYQLFMNILIIIVIALAIILISFFKWNKRLINNLKDIQLKLDTIGAGNLKDQIVTDHYTVEFQEVMYALERMRKRLYENEQVKQDMIHNISHDLKTPLAVIKNYAEGIIDSVYPYGTVEETAHVIYNQADRLQKRVQGLLYLNKLEYMRSQNETYDEFDLKALVLEVVSYMQDLEAKVQIELDLDTDYFIGDIEKWRVVIENLLDNAKRYAKQQIKIKVKNQIFTIYNDGIPIEECMNGNLFKPFEVGQGGVTGLGLAIVKKTVQVYGYDITFKNECNGGVIFSIYKRM